MDYGLEDRISIVEKVLIDKLTHREVAYQFKLSEYSVSRLVRRVRKEKDYLSKLLDKREADIQMVKIIEKGILDIEQSYQILESVEQLQSHLKETY